MGTWNVRSMNQDKLEAVKRREGQKGFWWKREVRKREESVSLQKGLMPILLATCASVLCYLLSRSLAQLSWLDYEEHVKARFKLWKEVTF